MWSWILVKSTSLGLERSSDSLLAHYTLYIHTDRRLESISSLNLTWTITCGDVVHLFNCLIMQNAVIIISVAMTTWVAKAFLLLQALALFPFTSSSSSSSCHSFFFFFFFFIISLRVPPHSSLQSPRALLKNITARSMCLIKKVWSYKLVNKIV